MAKDDDAAYVQRSKRPTPRLSSSPPRRGHRRSPAVPTSSFTGLRRPSVPNLEIEHITSPPSVPPPGSSSGTFERPAPSGDKIDSSIRRLLEADRKEAAADVARAAGLYERALEWYVECGLHHGIGACLRALGRADEAIAHLTLTRSDGPHYREACREIAHAAISLGALGPYVGHYLERFADSGPRSDNEIAAFLDLAELYWDANDRRRAERCLTLVLRLDPGHVTAQLMRLTWASQRDRENGF